MLGQQPIRPPSPVSRTKPASDVDHRCTFGHVTQPELQLGRSRQTSYRSPYAIAADLPRPPPVQFDRLAALRCDCGKIWVRVRLPAAGLGRRNVILFRA